MRASELRGLPWDNADFERNVSHVRQRANLWGEIGDPKSVPASAKSRCQQRSSMR